MRNYTVKISTYFNIRKIERGDVISCCYHYLAYHAAMLDDM